jgi:predicted AAA+ superfamily ATPase
MKYINRRLSNNLNKITEHFPVAVLTGARQVGKSTLLQNAFADYAYLSLDDFTLQEKAIRDPASLWIGRDRVILDEVQKFPSLLSAVKLTVDQSDRRNRFILSGSANLMLMQTVTETLAGRAMYLELHPLTYGEERGVLEPRNLHDLWDPEWRTPERELDSIDPQPYMLRGFFPPLLALPDQEQVLIWLEGYVRTYLERDLRALSQVDSLVDFRRLMQAVALRTGNVLNQADVARDCGLSPATTLRYLRLIETSQLFARLMPYSRSRKKRLVKSPKIMFLDPALSIFLSGIYDEDSLKNSREIGGYYETLVYLHLRAWCEAQTPKPAIYHWRTVAGLEVDFVIERGRKLLALEVKLTNRPGVQDIRHLLLFLEEYPETVRGVLVHTGNRLSWLHSRVIAVPWWWLDL